LSVAVAVNEIGASGEIMVDGALNEMTYDAVVSPLTVTMIESLTEPPLLPESYMLEIVQVSSRTWKPKYMI
jgi:hypothetical protein